MEQNERFANVFRLLVVAAVAGLAATSLGCTQEYDFERAEYQRGTLGEELFGVWHKDAKRAAEKREQKTQMLVRNRHDFVTAVDTIAPPDKLGEVDRFLQDVLALIDDGLMQGLTRKLRVVFLQAAADTGLMEALAIENRPHPEDFLSPVNGKNFLGHLLGYPRMSEVATRTTDILLSSDGVDRQGNAALSESTALSDLMGSLTISLREEQHIEARDTIAFSMKTVLVSEDLRFNLQGSEPLWAVQYDRRGIPMVKKTSSGLPVPFVDSDGDGLADVDSDGNFVLSTGESRDVPPFETRTNEQSLLNRDTYGRGSAAGGDYVFEYVDLSKTGLHFMTRQLGQLTQRGILWDMVDAAPAVLGPREVKSDAQGPFAGYSADNPVTDLMYSLLHTLDIDRLDEVLASLADFMDESSSELAGVMFALDEAAEIMDSHPDAGMEDNETVAHDLLPVLERIAADPELWQDFFWALRQPVSRYTGEPLVTLVQHRDQNPAVPAKDGPYDSCFQDCKARFPTFDSFDDGNPQSCRERYAPQRALQRYQCIRACPISEVFSEPMDFDAPEAVSNRSMLQRLMHLLRDAHQTPYGLAIVEPGWLSSLPPLIDLPDSAGAMVRSIGGELDLADYVAEIDGLQPLIDLIGGASSVAGLVSTLSPLLGAKLDRRATPDQITRLFNLPELTGSIAGVDLEVDPPVCKDGYAMSQHHADILYASEASGLYDTMAPLACAFSKHDKEALLGEMFTVMHNHYSSRTDLYSTANGATSPMKGANLRSYEPALAEILQRGTLFEALYRLSVAADRFKSDSGIDFNEQLRLLVHNATRTDDGFTGRNGEAMITLADGRTVRELSRLHLLMEAADQMSERVENNPAAEAAFENMMGALYDVMLAAEWPDGEQPRFQDPGSIALTAKLTRHLSEKAAEARQQGRLTEWLTDEQMQNVVDMWNSRTLPALVDLSEELASSQENKALTDDLMTYLLGAQAGRNQAAMAAYVLMVYTLHQDTWVPLSHFLATVLDPNRDWEVEPYGKLPLTSHVLQLLRDSVERDTEGHGLDMFERGFSNRPDGSVPFGTVFGIVADYFRVDPASQQPYSAEDYEQVFRELAAWLGDDVHGIEQLYDIVRGIE
ncbi:hypothetical protein FIV42_12825 [Persicimonas caeni]|uniref:Uncharacterized protein n=1 Tax=Persicimonas caeni TaxID=2292766 RepID=A0A4Y6PTG8_PERCE|nr:hypothetical protein [Persicimonas caeni]QDG51598.1 hypothetical protein FIV42_12825 [Persicimonas caeni]QED32819.1 hypothetical protein FRD00_12820 [Persicimonas caeni]